MARMARTEVFAPDEVAVVHVMNRVVRRCYLLGNDPVSGKNYDHRKVMIEKSVTAIGRGVRNRPAGICHRVESFSFDSEVSSGCCVDLG